jgi:two-component system response regulator (stage 0 sporulation protein F)
MNSTINILLVEDDKICQLVFLDTLATFYPDYPIHVVAVRTGTEAIHLLTEYDFNVLVLDLRLPDIKGEDVLSYKNAHEKYNHLACHVVTAYTEREIHDGVLALGAKSVHTKPLDYFELLKEIISPLYQDFRDTF